MNNHSEFRRRKYYCGDIFVIMSDKHRAKLGSQARIKLAGSNIKLSSLGVKLPMRTLLAIIF